MASVFPYHVVKSVENRGVGGSACRCPVDLDKMFTDEDLAHCFNNLNSCLSVIKSPKV